MAKINTDEIEEVVRKAIKEEYKYIYEEAIEEIFSLVLKKLDESSLIGPNEKEIENYAIIKTDLEFNLIELRDEILEKLNNKQIPEEAKWTGNDIQDCLNHVKKDR